MKRFALLTLVLFSLLWSCSLDEDDGPSFYLEVMPIDSVEMPEEFVYGESYELLITYTRPTFCYAFNNFAYDVDGHQRTIAVVNTVYTNIDCLQESGSVTVSFELSVTETETYVFKFFMGKDNNGQDQYYLVEVPVVQ